MTVYADVLLVVNYIVNLLILSASAKIMGAAVSKKRLCLASLLGAAGAFIIFFPYVGGFFQAVYKVLLTCGVTAAAYGVKNRRRYLKALLITCGVSFLFGGGLLALSIYGPRESLFYYNGVVYLDISALKLIFWTTVSYVGITLLERLLRTRVPEDRLCSVELRMGEDKLSVKGFFDTGNRLKEPFSGAPVILFDKSLLPLLAAAPPERKRIIPCQTVTGGGVLEGFRPDAVTLTSGGRSGKIHDVYAAVGREPFCGDYQALVNPLLLGDATFSENDNKKKACMKP